jgi:hypothetical protein
LGTNSKLNSKNNYLPQRSSELCENCEEKWKGKCALSGRPNWEVSLLGKSPFL